MGGPTRTLRAAQLGRQSVALPTSLRRRKPRSYLEWQTLSRWGILPAWCEDPMGFRLRQQREARGLSQRELAGRLGCSQQAVAQAERWESNPTVEFLRAWAKALDAGVEIVWLDKSDSSERTSGR